MVVINSQRNKVMLLINEIRIGKKTITNNSKTFIIGEISANHNGKIENATKLIKEAKRAGVDAVKLQTYTPDTITLDCDNDYFQIKQGTIWDGKKLYDLYKEAYMPWEWHEELMKAAKEEDIICFSTPFDKSAVDFLEDLNVPAYKIASFEITDIPLIEYAASKKKPVIISTGIAELADIEDALLACNRVGNDQVILLKCTSSYPAPYEEMNLSTIDDMRNRFNCIVGLSDHTLGSEVSIAGVALGAKVIEKHITLNRADGGPDAAFSMEINELEDMVKKIRNVEKSIGVVDYSLNEKKKANREFSRSLFISEDVKAGDIVSEKNIKSVRPSFGLHTKYYNEVLGKRFNKDFKKGTPLSFKIIE